MSHHDHAVPAHIAKIDHLALNRTGLWLFFFSETMIFLVLLFSRFYLLGTYTDEHINQELGLIITVVLLISSFTAYMAEVSASADRRKAMMVYLTLTIILGTAFLFGVVFVEWPEALHHGITWHEGYGMILFFMTGMHAFHVLTGIIFLIAVLNIARKGGFSHDSYWGVESAAKYWHFVDLVWVFFYVALYLI